MSGQTSYSRTMLRGYPGQRVGTAGSHKARSLTNSTGSTRQVDTVTVDTAANSTAYTFTINSIAVSITSGVGATKASIVAQLVDKVRSMPEFDELVAANPLGSDKVQLTAKVRGTGFTTADSDANLTSATVTANVAQISIPFGRAVVRISGSEMGAKLPDATGQQFLGVAERIHSVVDPSNANASDPAKISPLQTFSAVYDGLMLVETDMTVAPGDPVYFRHTTASGDDVGKFRMDADTNKADAITGAVFESGTTGAGLAVIKLPG